MKTLVSLAEAKTSLGIGSSLVGRDARIQRLLESISYRLEADLRTEFERAERVDRFFIDETLWKRGVRERQLMLLLRSGLVETTTPAPVVRSYATVADLQLQGDEVDQPYPAELVASEGYFRLYLNEDLIALNNVIEITYTSGLLDSGGVYQDVPGWLKNLVFEILRESSGKDGDCGEGCTGNVMISRSLASQIEHYIRFEPLYAPAVKVS